MLLTQGGALQANTSWMRISVTLNFFLIFYFFLRSVHLGQSEGGALSSAA